MLRDTGSSTQLPKKMKNNNINETMEDVKANMALLHHSLLWQLIKSSQTKNDEH